MRRWLLVPLALLAASAIADDGAKSPVAPPPPATRAAPGVSAPRDRATALAEQCRYVPAPFEMKVSAPAPFGARLVVEKLEFPSPVASAHPQENDTVRAKLFRTEKPEPVLVVALGGWRYDPVTPALGARLAEETGIQVLVMDLPFQGERTPKGKATGQVTFSADLAQNHATFVQSSQDVARAVDWFVSERKVDPKRVGVLGTSLGGYVASDLYGMSDRFSAAVVQISGGDIATVIFNGNFLTKRIRDELTAGGVTEEQVREDMRALDPTTWARKERKDGILLIAAENDDVIPLPTVKALSEAYGGARLVVMPGAKHIDPKHLETHFPEAVRHFRERLLAPAAK